MSSIFAGNYAEAEDIALSKGLRRFHYIEGFEDVRALRPGSVVWVGGTYHQRKDFEEIAEACSARDISFVDPCASLKGVR